MPRVRGSSLGPLQGPGEPGVPVLGPPGDSEDEAGMSRAVLAAVAGFSSWGHFFLIESSWARPRALSPSPGDCRSPTDALKPARGPQGAFPTASPGIQGSVRPLRAGGAKRERVWGRAARPRLSLQPCVPLSMRAAAPSTVPRAGAGSDPTAQTPPTSTLHGARARDQEGGPRPSDLQEPCSAPGKPLVCGGAGPAGGLRKEC